MTINETADSSVSTNNTDAELQNTSTNTSEPSQAPVQSQDDKITATPSDAGEKDDKRSLLDVVKDSVKKTKEDSSTSKQSEETSKEPLDPNSPKDKDEKGKENTEEDTRFDKHPRFVKINNELKTLRADMAKLQPFAQEYDNVEKYMKTQNLSHGEVAEGMGIMGLMKNDPIRAYQVLKPYFDGLAQAAGVSLSPELQKQVDEGMVERSLAAEMQRTKILKSLADEKVANLSRQNEYTQQETQAQQRALHIGQVVTQWDTGMFTRDPDYAVKQKRIGETAQAILNGRVPQSEDEAIQVCEQAHRIVTKILLDGKPLKKAIQPSLNSSVSSAGRGATPKPSSLLEAVQAGIAMTNTT